MADITQATESSYLTADIVESSPTKQAVIISGGGYEDGDYGKRLSMKVNIDTKEKKYSPNRTSAKNMQNAWGNETDAYVGKRISLQVLETGGKKSIIAVPMKDAVEVPDQQAQPPTQPDQIVDVPEPLKSGLVD